LVWPRSIESGNTESLGPVHVLLQGVGHLLESLHQIINLFLINV